MEHCKMDSHKRKTISGGHYDLGAESKKLNIKRIQDGNAESRYDITVKNSAVVLQTEREDDNPPLTTWKPSLDTQIKMRAHSGDKGSESKCKVSSLKKVNNKPASLLAKCFNRMKSNMDETLSLRQVVNYEGITYDDEEKLNPDVRDDLKCRKTMSNSTYLVNLLRSSYLESNNVTIKYNSIVCSSCELILKADYRFIVDHCKLDSHKYKTMACDRFYVGPESKKLNIKQIQDANAKRRYDITIDSNTEGLRTEEKDDNPYLTTSNPCYDTQIETDPPFEVQDSESTIKVSPLEKDHKQLFGGEIKSILDSREGRTAKTKENEPTILLAKCGVLKQSNIANALCERAICNNLDVIYKDEDELNQNIDDSKCQKLLKSTNVTNTELLNTESETFVLQQNNILIRKENVYFCKTCNVNLVSGNTYLEKHIKTKLHVRGLADNMRKYFSMSKRYSAKELYFHGLYELSGNLFYCKRCDLILDATDRSNITKHSLSIDHNYALCQHLEKLYDDNILSMRLEHNVDSEKCKEVNMNLASTMEAYEEDDVSMEVNCPVIENDDIPMDNVKFNQFAIKETQISKKIIVDNQKVHVVSSKNAGAKLPKDNGTHLEKNVKKSVSETSLSSTSEINVDDRRRATIIGSNNSDASSDRIENLPKKLVIGSPKSQQNEREGFASDVALKRFLDINDHEMDIKGVHAVKDSAIIENCVVGSNPMKSRFKLPDIEPIILNKSEFTLSDDDRIISQS